MSQESVVELEEYNWNKDELEILDNFSNESLADEVRDKLLGLEQIKELEMIVYGQDGKKSVIPFQGYEHDNAEAKKCKLVVTALLGKRAERALEENHKFKFKKVDVDSGSPGVAEIKDSESVQSIDK